MQVLLHDAAYIADVAFLSSSILLRRTCLVDALLVDVCVCPGVTK